GPGRRPAPPPRRACPLPPPPPRLPHAAPGVAVRLRGLMPKPLGPWPQCREPPNPAPQRLHPLLRQKKKES
ncbi:DUF3390 domain-containing protein, partial [Aeromonas dhakensis]